MPGRGWETRNVGKGRTSLRFRGTLYRCLYIALPHVHRCVFVSDVFSHAQVQNETPPVPPPPLCIFGCAHHARVACTISRCLHRDSRQSRCLYSWAKLGSFRRFRRVRALFLCCSRLPSCFGCLFHVGTELEQVFFFFLAPLDTPSYSRFTGFPCTMLPALFYFG